MPLPMFGHDRDPREVRVWRIMKGLVLALAAGGVFMAYGSQEGKAQAENLLVKRERDAAQALQVLSPKLKDGQALVGSFKLGGTGPKGSVVKLIVGGKVMQTGKVGDDGKWELSQTFFSAGKRELVAKFYEKDKMVQESDPVSLDVLTKMAKDVKVKGDALTNIAKEADEDVVYPDPEANLEDAAKSDDKPESEEKPKPAEPKSDEKKPEDDESTEVKASPFVISSHTNMNLIPRGTMNLGGKGKPQDFFEVFVNGKLLMKGTVKENGRWSAPLKFNMPGLKSIKVVQVESGQAKYLKVKVK